MLIKALLNMTARLKSFRLRLHLSCRVWRYGFQGCLMLSCRCSVCLARQGPDLEFDRFEFLSLFVGKGQAVVAGLEQSEKLAVGPAKGVIIHALRF
jgi:glucose-6-phosphate-specific signal transduction histidine kinase